MITFKEKVEHAKEIIKKAIEEYGDELAVGCSFGKDSMVLIHLALSVKPDIRIFSVMTPFKPKETLEYKRRMEEKYKMNIRTFIAERNPEENVSLSCGGEIPLKELHKHEPNACCNYFKVEQTKGAIKELGLKAWMSGLRKDEGRTRIDYREFEEREGLVKVNPILDFTEVDIWKYLACYGVPPNPLYKKGYRSLGCAPCTTLVDDSEEERAGRWRGTKKQGGECGIHTQSLKS